MAGSLKERKNKTVLDRVLVIRRGSSMCPGLSPSPPLCNLEFGKCSTTGLELLPGTISLGL